MVFGSDECIQPFRNVQQGLTVAKSEFLWEIVQQMEVESHPAVTRMVTAAQENRHVQQGNAAGQDGTLGSRSDKVMDGVRCCSEPFHLHSTASQTVRLAMHMVEHTTPFAEELPHELLRAFSADPSSAYAAEWRDFVTMIWAPGVTKLAAILDAHQSVMELPPLEWCEANFPDMVWGGSSIEWIPNMARAYAALFEVVVVQWERGDFQAVRPSMLCPLQAVRRYTKWSGAAAQQRLRHLIGMTEIVKKHVGHSTFYAATDSVPDRAET
jgi:hypothetical protein